LEKNSNVVASGPAYLQSTRGTEGIKIQCFYLMPLDQ